MGRSRAPERLPKSPRRGGAGEGSEANWSPKQDRVPERSRGPERTGRLRTPKGPAGALSEPRVRVVVKADELGTVASELAGPGGP